MRDHVDGGPYQVRCSHFVQIGAEFQEADIRSALPAGYDPASGMTGGYCVYRAETGWAITPYSAGFFWIDVDGLDSPAGAKGRCFVAAWYSEKAGAAFCGPGSHFVAGTPYSFVAGDETVATAGGADGPAFRIAARANGNCVSRSGVHNYVEMRQGQRVGRTVAYSHDATPVEPVRVEILKQPPPPLRLLQPKRLLWGYQSFNMVLTLGVTNTIEDDEGTAARDAASQVSLLSRVGRAAILLGPTGELIFMNEIAEEYLGDGLKLTNGRLLPAHRADEPALRELISAASQADADRLGLRPVGLRRPSGKNPLLIQAIPFPRGGAMLSAAPVHAVALLVTDPDRDTERNPTAALAVLGLTQAEARIAAAVGGGLAPRDVALRLGYTEATVRSALNLVYGKLGIHRQSELARIVSRLETLGI